MYDDLAKKAHANGIERGMELYHKQKMTYIMDEIKGEYLKSIAKEVSPEEVRHHYPRFAVSDL